MSSICTKKDNDESYEIELLPLSKFIKYFSGHPLWQESILDPNSTFHNVIFLDDTFLINKNDHQ